MTMAINSHPTHPNPVKVMVHLHLCLISSILSSLIILCWIPSYYESLCMQFNIYKQALIEEKVENPLPYEYKIRFNGFNSTRMKPIMKSKADPKVTANLIKVRF